MRAIIRRIQLFPLVVGALLALNLFAFADARTAAAAEQMVGKKCWGASGGLPAGCYECEHLCFHCNGCT